MEAEVHIGEEALDVNVGHEVVGGEEEIGGDDEELDIGGDDGMDEAER